MWPFTSSKSLIKSDIFENMVDCHCHILPDADSGVQSVDEFKKIIKEYKRLGIKEVWITPDISDSSPNTPEYLNDLFQRVIEATQKDKKTGDRQIDIHLSSVNMIDDSFINRFESGLFIPFGKEKNKILISTNYTERPRRLSESIKEILKAGYEPVMVSPERYFYMQSKDYIKAHEELGLKLMLSLPSLVGLYGPEAKRRAKIILESDNYSYFGTDNHGIHKFYAAATEYKVDNKHINKLKEIRDSIVL